MRKLFALAWLLLLAGILCLAQQEHVSAFWQSRDSNYNIAISGGGGGFTGPLNIISGADLAVGTRALSSSTAGTHAVNVCNIGDAACADLSTNGTTGILNVTAIGGQACSVAISSGTYTTATGAVSLTTASSIGLASGNLLAVVLTGTASTQIFGLFTATTGTTGTTVNFTANTGLGTLTITGGTISVCTIKEWYGQDGSGTHNFTQATIANRAVLAINVSGSLSCGAFGAGTTYPSLTVSSTSLPATVSAVYQQGGGSSTASDAAWLGAGGNETWRTTSGSINATLYNGSFFQTAETVAALNATQGVMNGASSALYFNNNAGITGNAGTSDAAYTTLFLANDPFGTPFFGFICEDMHWGNNALTSTQAGNIYTNQHTFYGGAF